MAFFPDIVSLGSSIWHADGSPVDTLEALSVASNLDHHARRASQFEAQLSFEFPSTWGDAPGIVGGASTIEVPMSRGFDTYWTLRGKADVASKWIVQIGDLSVDFESVTSRPWSAWALWSGAPYVRARRTGGAGEIAIDLVIRGCAS